MNFKEAITADLDVFVNIDEYGEWVTLNGIKLRAVVIRMTGERQRRSTSSRNINPELHSMPLIGTFATIYFRTADYGRPPKYSEFIELNGRRYKVEESQEAYGLTRLECAIDSMNNVRRTYE